MNRPALLALLSALLVPAAAAAQAAPDVTMPDRADRPLVVRDGRSGASVSVRLRGARAVPGVAGDDGITYASALPGADVLHRPVTRGLEDFVRFRTPPAAPEVAYDLVLGEHVAGLRLVDRVLELVDAAGAPRLRATRPWVLDGRGERHDATYAVEGCAVDRSPRAPWGRAVVPPGARTCTLRVRWPAGLPHPLLVDPAWTDTADMTTARWAHAATRLADGRVLVTGGSGGGASAELFDPATGTWAATGPMAAERSTHGSHLLADGTVLVVAAGTERYDPASGTFSPGPPLLDTTAYASVSLAGGSVLVIGASVANGDAASAELLDPAGGSWVQVPAPSAEPAGPALAALPDGEVVAMGGLGPVAMARAVDGTWRVAGTLAADRSSHAIVALADGRVMIHAGQHGLSTPETELVDPAAGTVTTGDDSGRDYRGRFTMTLLPDGKIAVVGGYNFPDFYTAAELYDPVADSWRYLSGTVQRLHHSATLLEDGRLLVAGGVASVPTGGPLATAQLLGPLPAGSSCRAADDCESGFCVDEVCCDEACDAPCQACAAPENGAGADGVCGLASAGTDPHDDCDRQPERTCSYDGTCDGAGRCRPWALGTSCGGSCDGTVQQDLVCDGAGTCAPDPAGPVDCGGYTCQSGACGTACFASGHCAPGFACEQAACVQLAPVGAPCGGDTECATLACVGGSCSDVRPDGAPCERAVQCTNGACMNGICCSREGGCEAIPWDEGCDAGPCEGGGGDGGGRGGDGDGDGNGAGEGCGCTGAGGGPGLALALLAAAGLLRRMRRR